jgi:hypothetical protein
MRTITSPPAAILGALEAVDVRSPTSFSWMGNVAELPEQVVRVAGRRGIRRALVGAIRARLYDSFYTQGAPPPATVADPARPGSPRSMSHDLAAANEGSGCVDPGWRVVADEDGRFVAERGGLRLWVTAEEVATDVGGPRTGDVVAVRLSADLPALSPGFYTARGDRGFSAEGLRILDRVYFDLRREGAVPFVREVTRRLNRAELAFIAKVVDEPGGFDRRDAAVLLVDRRDRERSLAAAGELAGVLASHLDGGAPAMTLPLGEGVAFAEDPGGQESFGLHRCLLIADAAVAAAEQGLTKPDDRLEVVRERFAAAGTTVDAPYLDSPFGEAPLPFATLDTEVPA